MHLTVTTFRGAVIKVEVANFCAAMNTLIDQDAAPLTNPTPTQTWGTFPHTKGEFLKIIFLLLNNL